MRSRSRSSTVLQDRLAWQCASLLLSYPDTARLDTAERLLAHAEGIAAELLSRTAFELRRLDPLRAAQDYVQTFDMCRRTTMYLTYWTAGDTRNRGAAMLAFAAAYRAGGVAPPRSEAPDYLPVVLEFAATVDPDRGRRLLVEHRVAVDVLRDALTEAALPVRARRRRGVGHAAAGHARRPAACPPASGGRCAGRSGWLATVDVECSTATQPRR